jgi:5-methylcytosine-specific restriction protein A
MFRVGEVYNRIDLHHQYGGQPRSRISTPADHPFIFLFADEPIGERQYLSGWTNYGIFRFVGEGRYGHMAFTRGNRALRHHLRENKRVHLFLRVTPHDYTRVRYEGEVQYSAHFYKEGQDLHNEARRMIVFLLKPLG